MLIEEETIRVVLLGKGVAICNSKPYGSAEDGESSLLSCNDGEPGLALGLTSVEPHLRALRPASVTNDPRDEWHSFPLGHQGQDVDYASGRVREDMLVDWPNLEGAFVRC